MRECGVSPSRAAIFYAIRSLGKKATVAEISRWLLRRPHSISGEIQRMERDGLVKKIQRPNRKNINTIVKVLFWKCLLPQFFQARIQLQTLFMG